jgi:hypothetical protein
MFSYWKPLGDHTFFAGVTIVADTMAFSVFQDFWYLMLGNQVRNAFQLQWAGRRDTGSFFVEQGGYWF